ncbi:MAG: hypothetical protein Q7O66_09725 [Dehalococcoidia bacterium]|nr:hypothetical protein [Dehalococcoidia bacterium]
MSGSSTPLDALETAIGIARCDSDGAAHLRQWPLIAIGAAGRLIGWSFLFVLSLLIYLASGLVSADSIWFVQVTNRLMSGEVLYRDVFFGATPLSVYLTAAFATFLGVEMLTVRVVMALSFVATLLLCCHIARQLGLGHRFLLLLVPALFVYAWPSAGSPYGPIATAFFLACFSAALWWRQLEAERNVNQEFGRNAILALAIAGLAAGLSFASKQDVGLYALGALLVVVWLGKTRGAFRPGATAQGTAPHKRALGAIRSAGRTAIAPASVAVGAFLIATALVFVPVWRTGGGQKLLEYGFTNKGAYLTYGQISYLDGIDSLVSFVRNPGSIPSLELFNLKLMFLLPPLAFVALLVVLLRTRPGERGIAAVVLLFAAAAFVSVFPRAASVHLSYAMPTILLALAFVWYRIEPGLPKTLARVLAGSLLLWLLIGLLAMLGQPWKALTSAEYHFSTLPHLRGTLVRISDENVVRARAAALAEAANGEEILILSPWAALYYLTSGLHNPIASDYPLVTTFGHNGEVEIIDALAQGKIRTVCLDIPELFSPLRPVLLGPYVQANMEQGAYLGICTLYHRRP